MERKIRVKCLRCGSTEIQRWLCPIYVKPFSPYNDDQLYCYECGYRKMVKKGIVPYNWNGYY